MVWIHPYFIFSGKKDLASFTFSWKKGGFLTGSLKKGSVLVISAESHRFVGFHRAEEKKLFILYVEAKKTFFLLFWGGKSNGEYNSLEEMKTVYGKSFLREAEENSRENLLNIRTAWSLVIVHDKEEAQTTYTLWKALQHSGSSICIWWNRGRKIIPNLNITQWKCKHIIPIQINPHLEE